MAKIKTRNSDSHKTRPKGISKDIFERVYWPYIPLVLVISALLVVGNAGGGLKAAIHHPIGKVLSYSTSMSIGGLLSDTNAQRTANGVTALGLNDKLDAAAQAKADDMASRNYWSHYTPEGNPPWIFVTNQSYSYQKLGENLAAGFSDEQSTINGWMASPPHRENLLDPAFSNVGFGFANNPNYTSAGGGPMTIVVAFYGQPAVVAAAPVTPPPAKSNVQGANTSAFVPVPAASEDNQQPAAATPQSSQKAASQPATTSTPKAKITPAKSASRIQLAAPSSAYGPLATKLSLILGLSLGVFWASRHLRALRKLLLEGERYVIRHPLTDLSLLVIAGLLFILSQTAGLIQ
jgi:hypothetical protein